jgi:SpoVK/Ycf46/Vps4 family AAA+-type ATPase
MILQLLIELEGADQRKDVFVIGATNRYLFGSSSLFPA